MVSQPAIFISSTGDLRSARDLVAKVLHSMGYEPIWQDVEATTGGELLGILQERISRCDMMIQLVGHRYGAEPAAATGEFGRVSYTQFEALYAEKVGQTVLYHFIEPGFPTDPAGAETEELRGLQEAYRRRIAAANRLRQDHIRTAQDLELSIRRINNELTRLRKRAETRFNKMFWLIGGIAAGVVLAIALTVVEMHRTGGISGQIEQVSTRQQAQLANEQKILDNQQRLIDALAAKPLAQGQSRPEPPGPEVRALAESLPKDDPLNQALQASVEGRYDEADRILQALKTKAGNPIDEAFRLTSLEGDNWYQAGNPDKAIGPYEQALALRPEDARARTNLTLAEVFARQGDIAGHRRRAIDLAQGTLTRAAPGSKDWVLAQNALGAAWDDMPTGDRGENLAKAMAAFQAVLVVTTQRGDPTDWAMTQINLGNVWNNMPTGQRAENLQKAIAAYEAALTVYTKESNPAYWAVAQNNLGVAWSDMPKGDKAENQRKAIAAYDAALTVRTKDSDPAGWAATENDLGHAWNELPTGDKGENVQRAIAAYTAALTVRTKDTDPAGWARVQNNLGAAWKELPTGDKGANFQKAIAAYQAALTVRTKEAAPVDWADTQYNLGNLWSDMPTGDQSENMRKAIGAYEAALTVYTREGTPMEWADAETNLGAAWNDMPAGDKGENLHKAIGAYEATLAVRTKEADPPGWAAAQINLGIAWWRMPKGDKRDNLNQAIAYYEAALTVLTRATAPEDWAATEFKLSVALGDMADVKGEDKAAWLGRAIASEKGALDVYTAEAFPRQHANVTKNMELDRQAYEAAGGTGKVAFDAIVPAR